MIPVPGIHDNPELGIRRGKLKVSGRQMVDIFHPILLDVLNLVQGQIQKSKKRGQGCLVGRWVWTESLSPQLSQSGDST